MGFFGNWLGSDYFGDLFSGGSTPVLDGNIFLTGTARATLNVTGTARCKAVVEGTARAIAEQTGEAAVWQQPQ